MDTTGGATRPAGEANWRPWLEAANPENRLAPSLAIIAAMAFQLIFAALAAETYMWIIQSVLVALEALLLAVLITLNPHELEHESPAVRRFSWTLTGTLIVGNTVTAVVLDFLILSSPPVDDARVLLGGGAAIFVTNVIAYAIMYWEFDRGGPFARRKRPHDNPHPDFLFPQMSSPGRASHEWRSNFIDYLYVSLTNVTAFSPTDTMPLTRPTKMMMAAQSLVAFSTAALVIARAVNVLK
jgi:hypothetical protein